MKILFQLVLIIAVVLFCCALIFGLYRTSTIKTNPNQLIFLNGKVPTKLPDGMYKGDLGDFATDWKGKRFDRKTATGINVVKENFDIVEKYPFTMSVSKGLKDKELTVIKLDYNVEGNPLWVRLIVDEIVATGKDEYLGKLHVKFYPVDLTLGFFTLKK